MKEKKYYSKSEVLIKAANYCAYQERCHQEVIAKLAELGVYGMDADVMLLKLIEDNYVNEERFAKAFAGGKFRVKQWGRFRIKRELKMRGISDYCIQEALKEIDETDYMNTLKKGVAAKYKSVKAINDLQRKHKTAQYLLTRGFESELIWKCLNEKD